MGRYDFTGLEDRDIFAVWLLSQTQDGKTDEVEFVKLLDQRRGQVKQEVITLSQDLEKLEVSKGISRQDFERMGRVYLTSMSENCTMKEAEEIITTLDLKRTAKPEGDYAKIVESMKTPSYGSPKPKSNKVEKLSDDVEWIRSGEVKLELLKRKFRR